MSEQYSILYLDDEEDNLTSFKAVFRRNFKIYTAKDVSEAWEILSANAIDLVISDQRMPGITGVEFLEKVHQSHSHIIRMILTGYSDMQAIIDAINKGKIYHYITKPWKFESLKVILDNAFETYTLRRKNALLEEEKKLLLIKTLKQEKEQVISQYEILKNQINPHFLFNCLNTLASLIGTDQEKAIKFTTRFSRMYRNILEYGDQPLISLEKEMELINTYLYLQQLRFGDYLRLNPDIKNISYCVPPFALQLLVENAIKHNIVSDTYPMEIKIVQNDNNLTVTNRIHKKTVTETSSGIGLQNLKQRYQLLGASDLVITNENGFFTVVIPLIPET